MPDNGAGTFTVLNPPFTPNTVISSSETNGNNSDFATGLTNRLTKDGDTDPTANLPMAGFKHTGVTATSGANSLEYMARDYWLSQRALQNFIDNPSGEVNQRGTTSTANDSYGGPDRWYTLNQTGATSWAQGTNLENTTPFYQRGTQSQAGAQRFGRATILQSADVRQLRGQTIALQARVQLSATANLRYAVLEWTGTADAPTSDVVNDWTSSTYTTGNFFISTTTSVVQVGVTSLTANTPADITVLTGAVSASMNNLIVFFWTEGTAAQNVTLDIAKVKLTTGSVQTPFYARAYEDELVRCVWRFERLSYASVASENIANGATQDATLGWSVLSYREKAKTPAISTSAAGTFQWVDGGNSTRAVSAISGSEIGRYSAGFSITISGATTGGGYLRRDGTDTTFIDIDAEI